MIILGIDPGTTATGFAFIDTGGAAPRLLEAGILPVRAPSQAERLLEAKEALEKLIAKHRPQATSIEKLFFAKNAKTAISVAEMRGAVLLITRLAGLDVYEYTPLEIKKAVTGDGGADKAQVKKMIEITMGAQVPARARDDIYDAIAAALTCHFGQRHAALYKDNPINKS